jgi:uncharacterized protein (TIGR00255 family)
VDRTEARNKILFASGQAWLISSAHMKSMTGYGCGESAGNGLKLSVEVSSVNRKQSEISVNLPRELEVLEAQIRDEINRHISRGRLTVRVTLHDLESKGPTRVHINESLARSYARELSRLAKELKLPDAVSLELLARAPGVLQMDGDVPDAEDFWPAVKRALDKAMAVLIRMRAREGAHLAKDLTLRMAIMRKSAAAIARQAPKVAERYRRQLVERISSAGLDATLDEERLLKEVVYFADRSDISEELTRLQSHFVQFDDCLKSGEPVGRTLDFLAQEMNREVNTIGSKANDSVISREVVVLKAELERFREQAQNVE